MGVTKYCRTAKLPERAGQASYNQVHRACPAIRSLQKRVAQEITSQGYVKDVFGHIYYSSAAHKAVAYLIQGCGTGSLPKVQLRANYDTLHQWDYGCSHPPQGRKVWDKERAIASYGVLCGTLHDETAARISLDLNKQKIIATLQQLMFNMTKRFSPLFDNIPLRAKLYLSRTTCSEREEVSIDDHRTITKYLRE
jgi:hypothetical protein